MERQLLPEIARPQPFDFSARMRLVCHDMVARLPELAHIDLARVLIGVCQARKPVSHGIFASLTPLRFAGGATTTKRRGRTLAIQRVVDEAGREMLYVLNFYLPRFQDQVPREKLITVLHELWHISPAFDGDIRRHEGRYHAHTHSQAEYDAEMGRLADRWLAQNPPDELWGFLGLSFRELRGRHGGVVGLKVRRPQLLPVALSAASDRSCPGRGS